MKGGRDSGLQDMKASMSRSQPPGFYRALPAVAARPAPREVQSAQHAWGPEPEPPSPSQAESPAARTNAFIHMFAKKEQQPSPQNQRALPALSKKIFRSVSCDY